MACEPAIQAATDEELARQVRAGSAAAFAALARKLRPRVAAHLARKVARRDDVEDLWQETLLRVHAGLGGYDASRPLVPWVLAIASNVAIEAARKRQARPGATPVDGIDPADGGAAEPWREAAEADRRRTVWETARRVLSERQYEALRRFYADGADVAGVARAMGLTRTHVKVLLHRARKRLLRVPRLIEEM